VSQVQDLEGASFLEAIALFKNGDIGPDSDMSDIVAAKEAQMAVTTYKDAGVDIDAGNRLVERIKPACRVRSCAHTRKEQMSHL
jgi:hypothetical protein